MRKRHVSYGIPVLVYDRPAHSIVYVTENNVQFQGISITLTLKKVLGN